MTGQRPGSRRARAVAAATHLGAQLPFARAASRLHARLYRLSGGKLIRRWFGTPVLVLEVAGRQSGKSRLTPLIYARDGDRFVVSPSNGGVDRLPNWWNNLRHARGGVVHLGGRSLPVAASEANDEERERLLLALVEAYPPFSEYTRYTDRQFPIAVLVPLGETHLRRGD